MNAPLRTLNPATRARDELAGRLNLASFYAQHAEDYLELGDHAGLEYALGEFIRHARQVVQAAEAVRQERGPA